MGNFGGHALPGSFFIVFFLWWTVSAFCRYYRCKRGGTRYTSTVTFPCRCFCGRLKNWPIEACAKLILVSVGFTLEILPGIWGGKFAGLNNAQHATMFFYFGFSGVVDLLTYFKAPVSVPEDMDYIILTMALMVEVILFHFHLHGRSELSVLLHTLLIYAIVYNILSVLAEMRYRHSLLSTLARAYFLLLQGTWFWQTGFILYNPIPGAVPWKQNGHDEILLVTLFFTWHGFADILIILIIGAVIRRVGCDWDKYDKVEANEYLLLERRDQAMVRLYDDSDSDVEIDRSATTSLNSNP